MIACNSDAQLSSAFWLLRLAFDQATLADGWYMLQMQPRLLLLSILHPLLLRIQSQLTCRSMVMHCSNSMLMCLQSLLAGRSTEAAAVL